MGSMIKSTGIVAVSTMTSRVMGFLRDMLMANYFGAGGLTDAFFVAFRIPNMLRRFVAEGVLTVSFIPVYTDILVKKGEDEARKLAQKTLSIQMFFVTIIVTLGIIFSPQIVSIIGYGFKNEEIISLAVFLNRILFPYLFFVGFVAFSMGILNSHGYFFAPAFSPVLLNIGIIMGIVFLSRFFRQPMYGVAAGVIIGGGMQFVIQIPYLIRSGFKFRLSLDFKHPAIKKIFKLILPALFSNGILQINILIGTIYASMLSTGSISYLYYSDRLTELVLGVFIISIGNVVLPEMSRLTAVDDTRKLRGLYTSSVCSALFIALPAGIALMTIGFPVISVLFMRNEFTLYETEMTFKALYYASIGIPSIAVLRITTPTFFSLKDAVKPVISALIALLVYIISGYMLMHTSLQHAGLSLANTISVTLQMAILIFWLNRKIGSIDFKRIFITALKLILSGLVMAYIISSLSGYIDWERDMLYKRIWGLLLLVAAGGGSYFFMCRILRVEEIDYLIKRIKGKR